MCLIFLVLLFLPFTGIAYFNNVSTISLDVEIPLITFHVLILKFTTKTFSRPVAIIKIVKSQLSFVLESIIIL